MQDKTWREQLLEAAASLGINLESVKHNTRAKRSQEDNTLRIRNAQGKIIKLPDELREPRSQEAYLALIKKLAKIGRAGADISRPAFYADTTTFVDYANAARENGDISATDEFFCLAAFAELSGRNCRDQFHFRHHLCQAAARVSVAIELAPNSFSDKIRQAVARYLAECKSVLKRGEFEGVQTKIALEGKELRTAKEAERARMAAEDARERERRALEEQQQRFLSIKEFSDLCLKAAADPLPASVYVTPTVPTNDDWELIRCWMGKEGIAEQESEKRRMLSARLAEKAMLSFFQAQGCIVHDISITKLSESTSPKWPYYDLNVDGVPIDVKNVRRSRKNPNRYVSHCVPRFKEARTLEAVEVAGVLSHWLSVGAMLSQRKTVLFLGLTNSQEHERIRREIGNGPLVLTFRDGLRGPSFPLPWIFSYPKSLYQARTAAISGFRALDFPDWRICSEAKLNPLPAFIAAGRYYHYQPETRLSDSQRALVMLLITRENRIGLSLAVVFLSILEHFIGMLSRGLEDSYNAEDYAHLIFPTADRTRPLFLYDPLRTIDTLLSTLSTLWDTRTSDLHGFSIFRLQDLNILLGKRTANDSQWRTLFAYCGGWLKEPVPQRCGTIPLVLGHCRSCACGRLICPNCDFCSTSCTAARARKPEHHRPSQDAD